MILSRSPLTGIEYRMPVVEDDRKSIEQFLVNNKGKSVLVVQGLGFVGAVMSLVCANALTEDYAVIGVDLLSPATYWRIRSLNEGVFPLIADDPLIDEFYRKAMSRGNFLATHDPAAYEYANIVIVDVNLDVKKVTGDRGELHDFSVDLTSFKSAIQTIASRCREDVLLLVETTVPPGTCQKVVKPIMDEVLLQRGVRTDLYKLGHSYERVMPGPEYIHSICAYPRVYSGIDDQSANAVEAFLRTIIDTSSCELRRLGSTNATEMAKVLENSYRAMNISFVVEWSRFAEEAGVNLYEIVNAIRVRKTHANLMFPGIGVGGYCLTKDPLLASWSRKIVFGAGTGLDGSVNSVAINDRMPLYAFERLARVCGDLNGKRVAVLGVSYRGDVGDTRFTPVNLLVTCLEDAGAAVVCHDPYVAFWHERERDVEQELGVALAVNPSIVVISTGHKQYTLEGTISLLMGCNPMTVFDTIGLLTEKQIELLSTRHVVSVLGRGDI
jgi:UDP-N-acetyl-D-glucosamine dehydrogenase